MNTRLAYWLVARLYNYITARDKDGAITFMNYGFAATAPTQHAAIGQEDPDTRRKGLYLKVAGMLDHRDWDWAMADVLEVGSGRGGGAALIANKYSPRTYRGIDISDKAVAFCRKAHSAPGLTFAHGNAESLPVADGSVDLVLSVESSHCYPNLPRFIGAARRVLRPGGYLIIADFRRRQGIAAVSADLLAGGLAKIEEEDITDNVLLALQLDGTANLAMVRKYIPWWLQWFFRPFAGVESSGMPRSFKSRDRQYWIFVYRKPGQPRRGMAVTSESSS